MKLINRKQLIARKRKWRKIRPQIIELALIIFILLTLLLISTIGADRVLNYYLEETVKIK